MIKKITYTFFTLIAFYGVYMTVAKPAVASNIKKFGNLTATYLGKTLNGPVFNIVNILPGDPPESRTIKIKNDGKNTTQVYVEGLRRGPNGETNPKIETVLDMQIITGSQTIYNQKLSKFFSDSENGKGVKLKNFQKGETAEYLFKVTFPSSAGNEFQGKSVMFDIVFNEESGEVKGDHDNQGKDRDDHDKDRDRNDNDHNKRDNDNDRYRRGWDNLKSRFNHFFKFR